MTECPQPPENEYQKKDRLGIGVFAYIDKVSCCSWDCIPDQVFMPDLCEIPVASRFFVLFLAMPQPIRLYLGSAQNP